FDRYANEMKLMPATIRRWRPAIAKITDEQPHMAGITPEWCMDSKRRLAASSLSARTISNAHLASLRVLCRWAAANYVLAVDPMDGIDILVPKQPSARSRGFREREARTILSATLESAPITLALHHAAARRW